MDRSLKARARIELDLREKGVPSVPMLGRYNYSRAMPGLASHRHPGAIEICHLVRGRQTYYVAGKRFSLRGGDVFLTFPGEEHGTGGEPEEKGLLYWMTLRDPATTEGSLLGLPPAESGALWKALRLMSRRHFAGTPDMKSHLEKVAGLAHRRWSALSRAEVGNRLIAVLFSMLSAHNAANQPGRANRFQAVFKHIESHLDMPDALDVEKLAGIAELSPSRFKAIFKQQTGIPPAEYALRARIEEAARRLTRGGTTVTAVAFDLGFSSSQYFASVYKRYTNTSPVRTLRGAA